MFDLKQLIEKMKFQELGSLPESVRLRTLLDYFSPADIVFPDTFLDFFVMYSGTGVLVKDPDALDPYITFQFGSEFAIVDIFYGVYENKYDPIDIRNTFEVFADRLPSKMVAFGGDPGSNQICICCDQEHFGWIYFYEAQRDNLVVVFQSLIDFLENLANRRID